jgi:hypothetical protein
MSEESGANGRPILALRCTADDALPGVLVAAHAISRLGDTAVVRVLASADDHVVLDVAVVPGVALADVRREIGALLSGAAFRGWKISAAQ